MHTGMAYIVMVPPWLSLHGLYSQGVTLGEVFRALPSFFLCTNGLLATTAAPRNLARASPCHGPTLLGANAAQGQHYLFRKHGPGFGAPALVARLLPLRLQHLRIVLLGPTLLRDNTTWGQHYLGPTFFASSTCESSCLGQHYLGPTLLRANTT